ncbi:hypothetical protein AusDCA_1733 [Desulfitobacterium sp. AusDCA]
MLINFYLYVISLLSFAENQVKQLKAVNLM